VERGLIRQRQSEKRVEDERELQARARVPAMAFEIHMENFEVSDRVFAVISEAGYQTVGDLMLQMELDPDAILRLSGMGPKAMHELEEALEKLKQQAQEAEAVVIEAAVIEQPAAEAEAIAEAEAVAPLPEPQPEAPPVVEVEAEAELPVEVLPEVEAAPEAELPALPVEEEGEVVPPVELALPLLEAAAAAEAGEEIESLDQLFTLTPEVLGYVPDQEEEELEEEDEQAKKKAKKKKKKFTEMEYDPDKGVMVVKKKRKRGAGDWDESW